MFSLLYVSSATSIFSPTDLVALLDHSRRNNSQHDITGMLLYKDGNFMQLLEGEETSVGKLFKTIAGDPRHKGAIALLRQPITTRSFAQWTMGFRGLKPADAQEFPAYSDFLNTPLTAQAFAGNPSQAQKLLLTFKQKM